MLRVSDEWAFSLENSNHGDAEKVVKWNGHDDQGHEDGIEVSGICLLVVSCPQGKHGDEETYDE